jgi:hypothetical protein
MPGESGVHIAVADLPLRIQRRHCGAISAQAPDGRTPKLFRARLCPLSKDVRSRWRRDRRNRI